jgi:hypothetical protein
LSCAGVPGSCGGLARLALEAGDLALLERSFVGRTSIGKHLGGLADLHAGPAQHFRGLLDLGAELGLALRRTRLNGLLALRDGIAFRLDALADSSSAGIGLFLHRQRALVFGAVPEMQRAALIFGQIRVLARRLVGL